MVEFKPRPTIVGDLWFGTDQGLYHITNFGLNVIQISNIQSSDAIAIGKGTIAYGNLYAFNSIGGVEALRLSSNQGKTWEVISDANHGFGSAGANALAASWETSGMVFVGTNGRGVFWGTP